MKRLTRLVLWLYPAAWRKRYRAELEALIEDSGAGWRVIADLLKESVKMQLTTWSFGKLAGVLGLAGLIVAGVTSAFLPPTYVSQAELEFAPAPDSFSHLMQLENEILSRTSLASMIQDPRLDLYPSEREFTPLEDVIDKMRTRDIKVRLDSPSTFAISFSYPDKKKAQQTVMALTTKFIYANHLQARIGVFAGEPILEILDPPSYPMGTRIPFFPLAWREVAPAWLRPAWVSQAVLQFSETAPAENRQQLTERIARMQNEVLSRSSLSSVIQDPRLNLYSQERKSTPLEDVIEKMKRHDIQIKIASAGEPASFTISFRYPDKLKAQRTVQVLIDKFTDANPANRRYREGLVQTIRTQAMTLDVLDPPSLPSLPAKPNRYIISAFGLVGGLMLAGVAKLLVKLRGITAA